MVLHKILKFSEKDSYFNNQMEGFFDQKNWSLNVVFAWIFALGIESEFKRWKL